MPWAGRGALNSFREIGDDATARSMRSGRTAFRAVSVGSGGQERVREARQSAAAARVGVDGKLGIAGIVMV